MSEEPSEEIKAYINGLEIQIATYISQNAALLAASQWRPIETAPKDGTTIQIRVIMRWDKDAQGWGYFQDPKTTAEWMPLPKPPAV